ncbi:hypothetical protein EMPS_09435 [Entomortierella parvispora]|uniref:Uncharacterized protein n=1 Tax=Entomortierella parvispora TaxID=205924 RepID=A0A9P3HI62_9FUNG|nr:hypothetical protein EMPS_09435 [Entomortierella parvispora]
MGVIDLNCLALNGTRLVGLSVEVPEADFLKNSSNSSAVILVETSMANPSTLNDLKSLSVISVWKRNLSSIQFNAMEFMCHIDPTTGIFSAIYSSNLVIPDTASAAHPAGGFQYNPATSTWSNIALSPDYTWDQKPQTSFTIFTWPNTTTLYQATIGNSSAINIGVLSPGSTNGANATLVNYFNWTLDPTLYGYPRQLAYGNNAIYQIGSIITNTNTGAQDVMIAVIPLTSDPDTFVPPKSPVSISSSALDQCGPGLPTASSTFYADSLYLFCSNYTLNQDNTFPGDGNNGGFVFKYQQGGNLTGIFNTMLDIRYEFLGPYQAMPRGGNGNDVWCPSLSSTEIIIVGLDDINLGNVTVGQGLNSIGVPYGMPESFHEPNYKAIIGGSVAGAVVLLVLIVLAVRRWCWQKWRDAYWAPRRDRLKAKLVEMLTKDERPSGEHSETKVLHGGEDNEHKVEEISMNSFEMYDQGKILVTDDMELDGNIVDLNTAYMGGVVLEHHPRPNIVTVLQDTGSAPPDVERSRFNQSHPLQQTSIADRRVRGPQALPVNSAMLSEEHQSPEVEGVGASSSHNNSHRKSEEAEDAALPAYEDELSPPPTFQAIEPPSAPPNPTRDSPESPL